MPRLSKIGAAALAAFGWTSGGGVTASFLVVAGGGSGGKNTTGGGSAGGGGAGEAIYGTSLSLSPATTYTITVGAGAAATTTSFTSGTNGSNSSINSTIIANGGGGGGAYNSTFNGRNGGSGGGGCYYTPGTGGSSTTGTLGGGTHYGNNGGIGAAGDNGSGGGGGAGSTGGNSSGNVGGNGGLGQAFSISGTSTYYAGGGGGGNYAGTGGIGGIGGGGAASVNAANATDGTANTGGGGGGGGDNASSSGNGGAGGSGIVIISYPAPQIFWGGFVTTSGGNIIHTFTTSGSLTPVTTTVSATYLQVAGGGGGGTGQSPSTIGGGGGGGAGGYLTGTTTLNLSSSYTVLVGAGGVGGVPSASNSTNGGNSQFGALTASIGGGYGGNYNGGDGQYAASGGSGGGGDYSYAPGGNGTAGQGNAGGACYTAGTPYGNGGGGGAGAVGGSSSGGANPTASGGVGLANSISGTSTYYAGGGGSGSGNSSYAGGPGGNGGGGTGGYGTVNGTAGTANTGGGGGGGGNQGVGGTNSSYGGHGGSGVVIISYAGQQLFGGGVVTFANGNTIHTFNTSGTLTPISQLSADYLIVGGGGGGSALGGGGGAGGLLQGSGVVVDTASTYLVTVGAGGVYGVYGGQVATQGASSSFSIVPTTAVGGGFGGGASGAGTGIAGNGGSGGGGDFSYPPGSGTAGQGYAGGAGSPSSAYGMGGGGGSGSVGVAGTTTSGGNGGSGTTSSISGTSTTYAGGGGGGVYYGYPAGTGSAGGGNGGANGAAGSSATANTGSGGGGGGSNGSNLANGGSGGSGIVIIRYAGSTQLMAGGSVTITGGYVIHTFTSSGYLTPLTNFNNSLRFRASNTAYLSRTPTITSNRRTWTWSAWIKRGTLGTTQVLFGCYRAVNDDSGWTSIQLSSDNLVVNGWSTTWRTTSAVFRDPAAWYHVTVAVDTTQSVANNRIRIYVNGVEQTAFSTLNNPSQNYDLAVNYAYTHGIGDIVTYSSHYYFDGEMSNINFVDGQQLTPNAFGTFNSYGVWQPITYGGSYGTNGFYLPMNPGTSTYAGSLSSSYLTAPSNAVFAIPGDFTAETWFYPTTSSQNGQFFVAVSGGFQMGYQSSSAWGLCQANVAWLLTTSTVPTVNAWNHLAISRSGSNTSIFLNGVRVANGTIGTSFSQNSMQIGNGIIGYQSNSRLVKGTAIYDPSATTITVPTSPLTNVSGTSVLTYQNSTGIDNSSNAFTLTTSGTITYPVAYPFNLNTVPDYGPAGNNWTANNIQPVGGSNMDVMTDVPTLTSTTAANYCVLNPLVTPATTTIINGNLGMSGYTAYSSCTGSIGVSSGKWYFEFVAQLNAMSGITGTPNGSYYPGQASNAYAWDSANTTKYSNNSGASYGAATSTGDIVGVAFDLDSGSITFYKNGVSQGTAYTFTPSGFYFPCVRNGSATNTSVNFGQQPFVYTSPAGYVALNTYNL